jgi:cytochrome c
MIRAASICAALAAALTMVAAGRPAQAQDDAGDKAFHKYCFVCHSAEPGQNKLGPSLAGVVGRDSGSLPDYNYSSAMQSAGITWDEKTLDQYLSNPRALVPGTKMLFAGVKDDAERHAIIQYLASTKS